MPKILSLEAEVLIKHFARLGYSRSLIVKNLRESNIKVSEKSVSNVLNNVGEKRRSIENGSELQKFKRFRTARNVDNINKVDKMTKL